MRTLAVPAPSPSALRIGALSAAVSLNVLALVGLSLMQAALPTAAHKPPAAAPIEVRIVPRTPPAPTPMPPMPVTPVRPTPRAIVPPVPVAPVAVTESAWSTDTVAVDAAPAVPDSGPVDLAPGGGGAYNALTYIKAPPPKYPPLARRRGWEGEVMLRVLVGPDGRPLSVEVETGSGHALLDRAAREHVLATWRFTPAQMDGRTVQAWGRVPIVFALM